MDLIDRYVYDVGKRLPAKQRSDIEKEMKSLLQDALDARTDGAEPTAEDVDAVLREFGHPAVVAARYNGEKSLIGPRLYPTYRMVVLIVLGALALGLFVSYFLAFAFTPPTGQDVFMQLLQFFGSLVSSAWSAIGVVTVIFWGIERGMSKQKAKQLDFTEPWDPKTLPQVPKPVNQYKPAESIVSMVFIIIAMVIFNVFPDVVAVYISNPGELLQRYPILSEEALSAYLMFWNIGWVFALGLQAVLLVQGRWRTGTRLAHAAIQVYSIAVALVMLAGPALLNDIALSGAGEGMKVFSDIMPMFGEMFRWIFIVIIVVCALDACKSIYRAVKDRELASSPVHM